MGPNAYWSYTRTLSVSPRAVWPNNVAGSWSCDNWAAVTGHEADYTRPLGAPKPLIDRIKARADGLGDAPYVLFVGLAFLWKRTLTIDVDARRMTVA